MSEWLSGNLGDIADIVMGQSPTGESVNTNGLGVPLLNGPTEFTIRYPKAVQFSTDPKRFSKVNDILFCVRGSTTGRMNWADEDYAIGRGLAAIRHKQGEEYRYFVKAILDYYLDTMLASASGSTFPNVSKDQLNELEISYPPLPEQKAIASVLSSLDDKIDLLHRQNKTLEAMAETLLIQHVLPREDEQNDELYLLGDYLETISVTHKFPNPQVVFLNTSDIYKGKVLTHELSEVKGLPGQAKKSIKKGDILFSEIRPANGRYALIDFDADNYVVSTKLMVLRAKQPNLIGLLYFYLTNKQVTDWLQVLAESRSGTFPQITFDQVADLELRLPQGSDLDNLIGLLDDILLKQSANNKQIQILENLRDTLLPKLMSGEVRVQYQTEEVA